MAKFLHSLYFIYAKYLLNIQYFVVHLLISLYIVLIFTALAFSPRKNAVPTDLPVDTAFPSFREPLLPKSQIKYSNSISHLALCCLFYITIFYFILYYIKLLPIPSCLLSPCCFYLSGLPSFHWLCSDQLHPQDPEE